MNFNKKMYLIDENQYNKLLALNKTGLISPEAQVNQFQTKFMKDRIKNQNENENLWSRIHDKIEPLINSHANITHPPPLQPPPTTTITPPSSGTHHGMTSPPGTPISSFFPNESIGLPRSAPSVARQLDRSFSRVGGPSEGVINEEEGEGEEEEEQGAVGGELTLKEKQEKERDRRQSVLGDILKGASTRNRSKLISLYHTLCQQPNVHITPSKIVINGVESRGSTVQILSQLVSTRKTFDFRHDKELINALSNIPDILFVVLNKEAIWLILEHNEGKTNEGVEIRTPNTIKKRPDAPKQSAKKQSAKKPSQRDRRRQRESMQLLQDWGQEHGMDIDTRYPLTPGTVNDLLSKKGKGKLSTKRRLKWESLF